MRRLALIVAVAGSVLGPATPASAHGGDVGGGTAYRTEVASITLDGVDARTVEAGARLELSNNTGHSVEILGYSGEPYLDVRPGGTWQNVNSPAAYLNETLAFEAAVPPNADPTAPPSWRKISDSTTVRWHDRRTQWVSEEQPPQAVADPSRAHRLRDWSVPLRAQTTTYEIRGTLDWEPPPVAWKWWAGAVLAGLAAAALAYRSPRSVRGIALVAGSAPLTYGVLRVLDGETPAPVLILAGLLGLAAAYRHPPFYLALSGAVVAVFGGFNETQVLAAAVTPTAGPGWLARLAVVLALGLGAGMALTGVLRMRAAEPAPASREPGLSSSA
ncbi:hypothetical protein [Paractinoplanes brasiliensis]|uniref:Uncharacterized protein n=1 Tax=Paractinoplanes brasiliensis TaxID=52695 RepID=A0A4R6JQ10_9ACTN|nr:hypothetical protein [Actinoplanes brasiliensis]TDO38419.1 hypothetical protein C8E87_2073 [Actinoplanes brasiliensis]GID26808.1 hypothetical protein Abr02nite_17910 [Actinoplanes brasiliensis]